MTNARELTERLLDLLRREQGAMADFLVALADFDRRRLWLELGFPNLFHFLHRRLGLSAGAAHYRKTAAELIQRFPEVVEPLRDGRLCFTSICELARVINEENRAGILPRFFHASKQEARAVAAEISPREGAPHRAVVTALALPAQAAACAAPTLALGQGSIHPDEQPAARSSDAAPASPPASSHRATTEPLTADLRRLHVTVSKRFLAKLDAARDALSHSHPGADAEAILEAGLDLLLERAAKRKGIVERPRKRPRDAGAPPHPALSPGGGEGMASRAIPAAVKREVWIRDEGRCQWPLDGGGICGSTHQVEFDHIVPRARGGDSAAGNLRLCCRVHNQHAARLAFGEAWMGRFRRAASP